MKYKNIIIKLFSVFAIFALASCTEENPIESTITYFPAFEYEALVAVEVGTSFTPSVKAYEGDNEIDVTITGSSDTNTVGVYSYTFSATNSDGYLGTATQVVVVHDPSIVGTDVSGNIFDLGRPSRTGVISLVEGTTSIFYATDFGYSGTFPVYFQMDGDMISDIPQSYVFGNDHIDLTYDSVTKRFTVYIPEIDFLYTFGYQ